MDNVNGLERLIVIAVDLDATIGKEACLTVGSGGLLSTAVCKSPLPASQKFEYDTTTQQLTDGAGMCLTASTSPAPGPAPSPATATLSLGRLLHDGSRALLLLNNGVAAKNMTCDMACFQKLFPQQQQQQQQQQLGGRDAGSRPQRSETGR
jgi:hypothetical protein